MQPSKPVQKRHEVDLQDRRLERESEDRRLERLKAKLQAKLQQPTLLALAS